MTRITMKRMALATGILCIALAVIIFIFAEGLRRWYSGLFFIFIGITMLINFIRWQRNTDL